MKYADHPDYKAYYSSHVACPICGNTDVLTTLVGVVPDVKPDGGLDIHDTNTAKCACGWSGTVNDLSPKDTVSEAAK